MTLRKNIFTTLLLAIGLLLHQITPGAIGAMKFDLMLSFIFVSLFITQDFKTTILTGLLGGLITAMTTTFPGGQMPNIIDKFFTTLIVFGLIILSKKIGFRKLPVALIAFIGTVSSGILFLGSALLLIGLPASFKILFLTIVLPTAITNVFVTLLVYRTVKYALKSSGYGLLFE